MKLKKTIYIYQTDDSEPFACATKEEAEIAINDELQYLIDRWHYDTDEIAEARKILIERQKKANKTGWVGTNIGEHVIGYYIQEIEFDIDVDLTRIMCVESKKRGK